MFICCCFTYLYMLFVLYYVVLCFFKVYYNLILFLVLYFRYNAVDHSVSFSVLAHKLYPMAIVQPRALDFPYISWSLLPTSNSTYFLLSDTHVLLLIIEQQPYAWANTLCTYSRSILGSVWHVWSAAFGRQTNSAHVKRWFEIFIFSVFLKRNFVTIWSQNDVICYGHTYFQITVA